MCKGLHCLNLGPMTLPWLASVIALRLVSLTRPRLCYLESAVWTFICGHSYGIRVVICLDLLYVVPILVPGVDLGGAAFGEHLQKSRILWIANVVWLTHMSCLGALWETCLLTCRVLGSRDLGTVLLDRACGDGVFSDMNSERPLR